ncbi:MAG: hypothetical protein KJO07_11115, partial [Deltaproteobacteria bacterium]|nr:hypothetical protein [Deltaproteobacteria bacterium]
MKLRSPLRFALEGLEGAAILGGAVCTWPLSKRWLSNWGSHPGEWDRSWDGDELVSPIARTTTRAITINAPSTAVWKR